MINWVKMYEWLADHTPNQRDAAVYREYAERLANAGGAK